MNLAVFCPNWIGDAVMATPALTALRRHFAGARVVGVMKRYVAEVFDGGDWFDETLVSHGQTPDEGVWGVAQQLRQRQIDQAILFPNSFRSALTAWMGGIRNIVGYARGGRSFMLSERLTSQRGLDGKFLPSPIVDAYNRLVEHVGCPNPGYQMRLFVKPEDAATATLVWQRFGLSKYARVVGFNAGGAFGAAKHWPVEHFAELALALADQHDSAVLVLCGPSERELARAIVQATNRPSVVSLADEAVSIGLLKACVAKVDLLVTTDSGPRHFAAAFDKPVVTLFGPTHVQWTETYHPKAVHLQKTVPCGPCQLRVCPLDHRCMTQLLPGEVLEATTSLLAKHAVPDPGRSRWPWSALLRDRDRRAS